MIRDTALHVRLDGDSELSAHEQIWFQVLTQVATGRLRPGDPMPAVRVLAEDLGITTGAVERAYRELAESGVLDLDPRPSVTDAPASVPTAQLRTAAIGLVDRARQAGLGDDDVLDLVRRALVGPGAAATPTAPAVPSPRAAFTPSDARR